MDQPWAQLTTSGHPISAVPAAPSHPPYAEMITAAILGGNSEKEGGLREREIAEYIERVYSDLPPAHSALLTHHLTRLRNSGYLIAVKNSYSLSSSTPAPMESHPLSPQQPSPTVNPSTKRGPGRPPKPKSHPDQPTSEIHDAGSQVARKRGRPPKQQQQLEAHPLSEAAPSEEKRRPGRPPKQVVVPFSEPDSAVGATEGEAVKRQVGRPPKLNVVRASGGGSGRPRGRPRKSVLGPVSRPIGKQPRGRPRKLGGGGGVGVAAARMVAGKRRGRPPKGSNPRKPRRLSGKPLGRPRKDGSAARSLKFEQGQGKANEELAAKLELIQLKIREAVGIIKPYVANENVALVALQQLEELVITAPPATSMPPPTAPQPESLNADPSVATPPTEPAPGLEPFYSVPGTFSVNLPALDAAPLHMPSGIGDQQPMSWIASSGTQS